MKLVSSSQNAVCWEVTDYLWGLGGVSSAWCWNQCHQTCPSGCWRVVQGRGAYHVLLAEEGFLAAVMTDINEALLYQQWLFHRAKGSARSQGVSCPCSLWQPEAGPFLATPLLGIVYPWFFGIKQSGSSLCLCCTSLHLLILISLSGTGFRAQINSLWRHLGSIWKDPIFYS